MALPTKGERFVVEEPNVEDENERIAISDESGVDFSLPFLSEVKERQTSTPRAPSAPTPKATSTPTGFPAHDRTRARVSAFKKQRDAERVSGAPEPLTLSSRYMESAPSVTTDAPLSQNGSALIDTEHGSTSTPNVRGQASQLQLSELGAEQMQDCKNIQEENNRLLASMSEVQIATERQELLDSLDPELLQRLLRRAHLDVPEGTESPGPSSDPVNVPLSAPRREKKVTFESTPIEPSDETASRPHPRAYSQIPQVMNLKASTIDPFKDGVLAVPDMHMPRPPEPPELDPSSPSFLDDLHSKYFPNLEHDPSKLAWMRSPSTPASNSNPESSSNAQLSAEYLPEATSLSPAELRFDFSGALLPPRLAHQIPVTKGLHHHGQAPNAAGYTISELARLARSVVAAQRCISYCVLGRMLYRLSLGQFGDPGSAVVAGTATSGSLTSDEGYADERADLALSLWQVVQSEHVLEILLNAANEGAGGESRHVSAKAYAVEAVWLWRTAGAKRLRDAEVSPFAQQHGD